MADPDFVNFINTYIMPECNNVRKSWIDLFLSKDGPMTGLLMETLFGVYRSLRAKHTGGNMSSDFINRNLAPPPQFIFRPFTFVEIEDVKVILMGQDPYPKPGVASGLAFEANGETKPPSLKNVELAAGGPINFIGAARQGVLFLNAALTGFQCTPAPKNNHLDIWARFTGRLIQEITKRAKVYMMLWGEKAQKYETYAHEGTIVLKYTHPSPLADVNLQPGKRFAYCDHFRQTAHIIQWTINGAANMEKTLPQIVEYINMLKLRGVNVTLLEITERIKNNLDERIKYSQWLLDNHKTVIKELVIHTDGSAEKNGKADCKSFWAYVAHHGNVKIKENFGPVSGPQSSCRGELQAILEALHMLEPYQFAHIKSDSQYAIDVITGAKKAHVNRDLIDEIIKLKFYMKSIEHVKGHAGNVHNEYADALANIAKTHKFESDESTD